MKYTNEYRKKLVDADTAVKVVQSGDWVDYSFGTNQPVVLDEALARRKSELKDIKIRGTLEIGRAHV